MVTNQIHFLNQKMYYKYIGVKLKYG